MNPTKKVACVLTSIVVVGALGIPLGDPRFIPQALILEGCFVALAVLSWRNYQHVYTPNFIISGIVIAGNSAFSKHIEIMTTFHPLHNAIVLIIGGYVLQVLLLLTNYLAYKQYKHVTSSSKSSERLS